MEKSVTLRSQFLARINVAITEDSAKFINGEKVAALKANTEYQLKKSELKALETSICTKVTNRIYAKKLAHVFGRAWNVNEDTLLQMIIDKDDVILRDGKPYAITTNAQAASFMDYLYKGMHKVVSEKQSEFDRIYSTYKGANDLGLFTAREIAVKVCAKHGISRSDLAKVLLHERKKAQVVKKATKKATK